MESNKLIAEFIGWTSCDSNDSTMYANPQDKSDAWSTDEMRFNESWNWLMPVAEKCLTTGDRQHFVINDALLTCNIEEVYKALVEFIKQHNDEQ